MGSKWREGRLGDFIELHRGYDLPQQNRRPGPVPLVSSSGISDHLAAAMIDGPGVVTGRYGTIGQVFYLDVPFWPLNTTLYVSDFKGNDPRFASYLLRTVDFMAFSDKAAVPGVNRNHVHEAIIRWPVSIDEQKRIAGILGALDDKIELNRRMNQTLESMARALFKSWFVAFEPVRAKVDGLSFGLPLPVEGLFPDSLDDSELGEIPAGWRVATLSEVADLNPESWSRDTRPEAIDYVDLTNTKSGRIEDTTGYSSQDAPSRAQRVLRPGDTIVGTVRPGNRSYALVADQGLTGSTGFAVLRPKRYEQRAFVYLCATADSSIGDLTRLADGAAYPAVRPEAVLATPALLPPPQVMTVFCAATASLLDRYSAGGRESRSLASIRDRLLPQLLTGPNPGPSPVMTGGL